MLVRDENLGLLHFRPFFFLAFFRMTILHWNRTGRCHYFIIIVTISPLQKKGPLSELSKDESLLD